MHRKDIASGSAAFQAPTVIATKVAAIVEFFAAIYAASARGDAWVVEAVAIALKLKLRKPATTR